MRIDIPDWMLEMSQQMNTDDNRCTAHPFWQVRQKKYIVTEQDYSQHHWSIFDSEEGEEIFRSDKSKDFKDLAEWLLSNECSWCEEWFEEETDDFGCFAGHTFTNAFNERFNPDYHDLPESLVMLCMQEIEEVITTHLTKSDADWFIERKKHDYPNAYTYVESAYWSPQFKRLQDWIKSLTDTPDSSPTA